MHSEFSIKEVIKERIEAAAHACHAQRHWVKLFDRQPGGTVEDKVLRNHQVEQEVDVIRGEAEQKESRAAQDHPQSSPLLTIHMLFMVLISLTVGGD